MVVAAYEHLFCRSWQLRTSISNLCGDHNDLYHKSSSCFRPFYEFIINVRVGILINLSLDRILLRII